MTLTPTPGQTVGPFFGYACPIPRQPPGPTRITGIDPFPRNGFRRSGKSGSGRLDRDLATRSGRLGDPPGRFFAPRRVHLHRLGRCGTDNTGHFSFATLKPGGKRPLFALSVFARGLLDRLFTRAYLPGPDLTGDAFLNSVDAARRDTLIAAEEADGFRFDIRLQGEGETVFLHFPGHRPGTLSQ